MNVGTNNRQNRGTGRCKYCGAPIFWFDSAKGNAYPCSSDNYRDFHNCVQGEPYRGNSAANQSQSALPLPHVEPELIQMMIEKIVMEAFNKLPDKEKQIMVMAGFRSLAQQFHPDHGGDHESMVVLNLAFAELKKGCGNA
jgi:hypothetical protein